MTLAARLRRHKLEASQTALFHKLIFAIQDLSTGETTSRDGYRTFYERIVLKMGAEERERVERTIEGMAADTQGMGRKSAIELFVTISLWKACHSTRAAGILRCFAVTQGETGAVR